MIKIPINFLREIIFRPLKLQFMIEEDVENIVEEKSLFQESTLDAHEKTQDKAQFACEFCNFFSKRKDNLKRHIKSWHSTKSTVDNQDFEEDKSNFDKEDDENILIQPRSKFRLGLSNPYQLHEKTTSMFQIEEEKSNDQVLFHIGSCQKKLVKSDNT